MDFFVNISKYIRDQWLIFDQVAVFGHVKRMIGLDCDFIAHINDKIEKTGLPTITVQVIVALCFIHFEDSVSPMGGGLTKHYHALVERGRLLSFILGVAKRGFSMKGQKHVEESTGRTFTKRARKV